MNAYGFQLYPAIDVRDGRVVRLRQGDYARETRYAADPFAQAQAYADAGASWLHLVDLDAARQGGYSLHALLRRIRLETGLRVQTGGGVRSQADVEALLQSGADRVVIGSLAVTQSQMVLDWLRQFGAARITIAFDARRDGDGRWWPASHGWTRPAERELESLVVEFVHAGLQHLLATDIDRDGMLSGPNLDLYALLRQWAPALQVQASGGARALGDVRAARDAACAGIVLGKALLEGHIDLAQALEEQRPC